MAAFLCGATLAPSATYAASPAVSTSAQNGPRPSPRLGRALSAAEVAAAGSTIYPDGRGLPNGSGNARVGKAVFAQRCARCHGVTGRGGSAPELVGGTAPLGSARPDKTIGQFWPFAATLFDFNWRAMPMDQPGSMTADESYAVTAYLLYAEGLVGELTAIGPHTLPAVRMPNRNGFLAPSGGTAKPSPGHRVLPPRPLAAPPPPPRPPAAP